MKKFNKLLSFILTLSLVLSVFVLSPASVGATTTVNEEALKLLTDLGIYDPEDEINFSDPVSRADFSEMAAKLVYLGDPSDIVYDGLPFVDIEESDSAYSAVELLCKLGFVKGTDSTHYEPYSYMEPEHSLILLVKIMGYDYLAKNKGSYFAAAQDKKLLNRVNFEYSDKLTYAEAYNLIYNALVADISDYNEIDGKPDEEGKETFLSRRHGIKSITGTITDDGMTSIYGESKAIRDEISVQYDKTKEAIFKCSDELKKDALGKTADVYYKKNDDTGYYDVISLCVLENRNNVVRINSAYILKCEEESGRSYQYTYYIEGTDEENEIEAEISSDHTLIYNGRAYNPSYLPEGATYLDLLQPDLGFVTLIDNNGDDEFDIVSIYNYETFVVGSASIKDKVIYSYSGVGQPKIDLSSKSITYSITDAEGKDISLSELKECNILSVAKSLDGKNYDIKYSNKTIPGTVTEKSNDKLVLAGGTFKLVYPKKDGVDIEYSVTAGSSGDFYIDSFGNIAYVKTNAIANEDIVLGYVDAYGIESKKLTDTVVIKMFTSRGVYKDYKVASKVTIDGIKYKECNEVVSALDRGIVDVNDEKVAPLIRVKFDDDGLVNWVDTAYEGIRESESIVKLDVSGTKRYYGRNLAFNGDIGVSSSSIIFKVPDSSEDFDPDKASVITRTGLVDNQEVNMTAYCIGDSNDVKASIAADVFVCESSATAKFDPLLTSNKFGIVTGVSQAYDRDNDDTIYKITVNVNGSENEFYTEDVTDIEFEATGDLTYKSKIEKGDLILYLLDSNGKLTSDGFKVVYDANKQSQDSMGNTKMGYFSSTTSSLSQWRHGIRIAHESAYNYKDNLFQFTPVEPNQIGRFEIKDLNLKIYGALFNNQPASFLKYNKSSNRVTTISAQDINTYINVGAECDKVFYRSYYGTLQTVIVYED